MGKKIVISESKLNEVLTEIINENLELREALFNKILDPLRNVYYGFKGAKKGFGYDYFRYVSELRNIARDLKRLDQPNEKIMSRLQQIHDEVKNANWYRQDLKDKIVFATEQAINHFRKYTQFIDQIAKDATQRIKS